MPKTGFKEWAATALAILIGANGAPLIIPSTAMAQGSTRRVGCIDDAAVYQEPPRGSMEMSQLGQANARSTFTPKKNPKGITSIYIDGCVGGEIGSNNSLGFRTTASAHYHEDAAPPGTESRMLNPDAYGVSIGGYWRGNLFGLESLAFIEAEINKQRRYSWAQVPDEDKSAWQRAGYSTFEEFVQQEEYRLGASIGKPDSTTWLMHLYDPEDSKDDGHRRGQISIIGHDELWTISGTKSQYGILLGGEYRHRESYGEEEEKWTRASITPVFVWNPNESLSLTLGVKGDIPNGDAFKENPGNRAYSFVVFSGKFGGQ